MPNNRLNIQLTTTTTVNTEKHDQRESNNTIVSKEDFVQGSDDGKAVEFWNILFGDYDDDLSNDNCPSRNPNYKYLTASSSQAILANQSKFISGFDFERLPQGFCFIEHPTEKSLSVLHYNQYLEKKVSPLAITLAKEVEEDEEEQEISFTNDETKNSILNFFIENIYDDSCTPKEIKTALIAFFNMVDKKNDTMKTLNLPEICLKDFQIENINYTNFNPIVVISRMATILNNPFLQPKNYVCQFKALTELPLADSKAVARQLLELQHSESPLHIVLPEHDYLDYQQPDADKHNLTSFTRTSNRSQIIDIGKFAKTKIEEAAREDAADTDEIKKVFFDEIEADFLKFISVTGAAAAIDFYRECFTQIRNFDLDSKLHITFNEYVTSDLKYHALPHTSYITLYKMLASSTCDDNFEKTEEEKYPLSFKNILEVINDIYWQKDGFASIFRDFEGGGHEGGKDHQKARNHIISQGWGAGKTPSLLFAAEVFTETLTNYKKRSFTKQPYAERIHTVRDARKFFTLHEYLGPNLTHGKKFPFDPVLVDNYAYILHAAKIFQVNNEHVNDHYEGLYHRDPGAFDPSYRGLLGQPLGGDVETENKELSRLEYYGGLYLLNGQNNIYIKKSWTGQEIIHDYGYNRFSSININDYISYCDNLIEYWTVSNTFYDPEYSNYDIESIHKFKSRLNAQANARFIISLLSNFNITPDIILTNGKPVDDIIEELSPNLNKIAHLRDFLAFHLKNMGAQSTYTKLFGLLSELAAIENLDKKVVLEKTEEIIGNNCFPHDYFTKAKQDIDILDLTTEQTRELTRALGEKSHLVKPILVIIKGSEQQNPKHTDPDFFNNIIINFLQLSDFCDEGSFERFCLSMSKIGSISCQTAISILQKTMKSGSLGSFNQFMFCYDNILQQQPKIEVKLDAALYMFLDITTDSNSELNNPLKEFSCISRAKELIAKMSIFRLQKKEICDYFARLSVIAKNYPASQELLLSSIETLLLQGLPVDNFITALENITTALDSSRATNKGKIIFSLLYATKNTPVKIQHINELLENSTTQTLIYISQLLDDGNIEINERQDDIVRLLQEIKTNPDTKQKFIAFLEQAETPPYPSVKLLIKWLAAETDINTEYAAFCKTPYTRVAANQFNLDEHERLLKGFDSASKAVFTSKKDEFDSFIKSIENNRTLSFQELQSADRDTDEEKLAYIVEMLARNAYQHNGQDQIAQELNTVQIMTLFVMMHNVGTKYMAQIDTGEGKSRIFITHAIWLVLKGKTVDLVTSNNQLSERDYLAYSSLTAATRTPTSLINIFSPPKLYQNDGINFSDNNSLSLLRIKHEYQKENGAFKDERDKRVLLIDEADTLIHDKVPDSYQFAEIKKESGFFSWVYEHLIRYTRERLENKELNSSLTDKDAFATYIQDHEVDDDHKRSFRKLLQNNPKQVISWLDSSHSAHMMQCGKEYMVSDEIELVETIQGHEYKKVIKVIENGRVRDGFIYQNGIHALLAAKEMQANPAESNIHIQPESNTLTSQNTAQFLADYDAITGVTGSTAHEIFNDKAIQTDQSYKYITVPNQKPNKRKIQSPIIMKGHAEQLAEIKNFITAENDKPILMFCEDDNEIEELNNYLKGITARDITKITAKSSTSTENEAISNAGQSNNITIATSGRMGRGTDIKNPAGNLQVLITYIPSRRDQKQISSRTARYGMPGTSHYIIDKIRTGMTTSSNQFSKLINERTYASDKDFYLKNEAINIYSWLKLAINEKVDVDPVKLTKILEQQSEKYIAAIQAFQDKSFAELEHYLDNDITNEIIGLYSQETASKPADKEINSEKMGNFTAKISESHARLVKLYKSFPKLKQQEFIEADEYHRSHDGQAVRYSTWFAKTRATFSGKRALFADTRAWWNGTGYFFTNYGVKFPASTSSVPYTNIVLATVLILQTSLIVAQQYATIELLTAKLITWISAITLPSIAAFIATPIGLATVLTLLLFTTAIATSYRTTPQKEVLDLSEPDEAENSSEFGDSPNNKPGASIELAIVATLLSALIVMQQYATIEALTAKLISWISAITFPSVAAFIVTPIGLATVLALLLFTTAIAISYRSTTQSKLPGMGGAGEPETSSEFSKGPEIRKGGFDAQSPDIKSDNTCKIM
ncbi:MAG: hypothetical protein HON55_04625 [Legionellales bacterium]|nr:hypothetical protein [Legionellales bacterium]